MTTKKIHRGRGWEIGNWTWQLVQFATGLFFDRCWASHSWDGSSILHARHRFFSLSATESTIFQGSLEVGLSRVSCKKGFLVAHKGGSRAPYTFIGHVFRDDVGDLERLPWEACLLCMDSCLVCQQAAVLVLHPYSRMETIRDLYKRCLVAKLMALLRQLPSSLATDVTVAILMRISTGSCHLDNGCSQGST